MWGQVRGTKFLRSFRWIIPTRVGTSEYADDTYRCPQDHPHACGDKVCCSMTVKPSLGSSPRVWGQGKVGMYHQMRWRIIPTRVGTSAIAPDRALGCKDHPHACGDKSRTHKVNRQLRGSSPRVWGQAKPLRLALHHRRIIPTRVGTSATLRVIA